MPRLSYLIDGERSRLRDCLVPELRFGTGWIGRRRVRRRESIAPPEYTFEAGPPGFAFAGQPESAVPTMSQLG